MSSHRIRGEGEGLHHVLPRKLFSPDAVRGEPSRCSKPEDRLLQGNREGQKNDDVRIFRSLAAAQGVSSDPSVPPDSGRFALWARHTRRSLPQKGTEQAARISLSRLSSFGLQYTFFVEVPG